jgi:GDP-D-mannose 3',5'-epimerase
MSNRVAVTGGAGFLGSHIVRGLIKRGDEVAIIDNLSSGSIENLRDLDVNQQCIMGDLRNYEFARESLRGADTVYHFAAEVGSVVYLHGSSTAELAAMQSNLVIDANVFRACIENHVRTIIYASSVSVYPFDEQLGSSHIQFREEDTARKVNPEGGYGWSKYVAEKQLELMSSTITAGIARIFHAYGQNIYLKEDRSQVVGSLIRKAIRYPKEDFVVWGNGTPKRCFVFIDDVLEALFKLQDYVEGNENLVVNIGSTEEVSVNELSKCILGLTGGKDILPKFDSSKPSGAISRIPNLERIDKKLGWKPKTRLSIGLERTYKWAEVRLGSAN